MSASEAKRDRWDRLGARLGLARVAARAISGSRPVLVGDRDGYLVAVATTHTLNRSGVDLLVRVPQQSTIRGLREDLLRHEALLKAFGRRRRLPRWRRRDLLVGDGVVMFRLGYAVVPPREERVARSLDALVAATRDHVRSLDPECEGCGERQAFSVWLVDGLPAIYCDRCVDALRGPSRPWRVRLSDALRRRRPTHVDPTAVAWPVAGASRAP
jgi:hypothetical protein